MEKETLSDKMFKGRSDMFNRGRLVREKDVKEAVKELKNEIISGGAYTPERFEKSFKEIFGEELVE